EHLFKRSQSSVRLYIRCYEKFSSNSGAVQMLSLSDMQLLIGKHVPDELVEKVIDAKKDDPDLSKRDIKKMIAAYNDQLAERDARLELVSTQLNEVAGELDDMKLQNEHLLEDKQQLQQEIDQGRESSKGALVALSDVNHQVSVLQNELANRERDL